MIFVDCNFRTHFSLEVSLLAVEVEKPCPGALNCGGVERRLYGIVRYLEEARVRERHAGELKDSEVDGRFEYKGDADSAGLRVNVDANIVKLSGGFDCF